MLVEHATSQDVGEPTAGTVADRSSAGAPDIHLYQIVYQAQPDAGAEPGYRLLDNRGNERPDWYEYWPIRSFLLGQPLDETAFYGFFSPKFRQKTNLSYAEVIGFARQHAATTDVILYSPQPDMGAFFLNVFEQGELFDPGLMEAYTAFLDEVGRPTALADLVMDSRHVVFSNYFMARPAFWREWLALNEAMFAICEGPDGRLKDLLCRPTTYPGDAQRKVFLQERAASLLLATQPRWRSIAHNPFGMGWSAARFRDFPREAYISDALKLAFREHRYPQYMEAFASVRDVFRGDSGGAPAAGTSFAPGQVIKVRHSLWEGDVVAGPEPHRLRQDLHGSTASYRLHDDLLLVDWDGYDPELFIRHGDEFRISTFDRDRRGLNSAIAASTTIADTRFDIDSIAVRLPDGMGTAHVRPGTSDIPVLEATCLKRKYDVPAISHDCDIIVDLGANGGLASIYFAHRYPGATIVAVEPARDNFRLLAANAQNRPTIIPVEAAIAPWDGRLDLQDAGASGGMTHPWTRRTVARDSGLGGYTVDALSLPTLMRRYGLGQIDLLKVDIEGAEYGLFAEDAAPWLSRVRSILIETRQVVVPGTADLISRVLQQQFDEMPPIGECRVFIRRS